MTNPSPKSGEPAPQSKKGLLKGARILIGDPLDTAAAATRASLRREGATDVLWRRTMKGVVEMLCAESIDLALVDMTMPDGDAIELARKVRFSELGHNPFLPLMITTWRAEQGLIAAALAAGADDLLAKPISASQVAKRVSRIALERKPFIATGDYIGPVRAGMAQEAGASKTFEAPNRLKSLALGEPAHTGEQQAAFRQAQLRLVAARLEHSLRDLSAAARTALADISGDNGRAALKGRAIALKNVVRDAELGALGETARRLAGLADMAARGGDGARKAATLTADIADAIVMIVTHQDNATLDLPADILTRIDSRFPALAAG